MVEQALVLGQHMGAGSFQCRYGFSDQCRHLMRIARAFTQALHGLPDMFDQMVRYACESRGERHGGGSGQSDCQAEPVDMAIDEVGSLLRELR